MLNKKEYLVRWGSRLFALQLVFVAASGNVSADVLGAARFEWGTTFEPKAAATYVAKEGAAILVAAGGERSSSEAPARALAAALRQSGKAKLVMTDEGLGAIAELDDAAIVKKAAALPVEQVFIVRAFPGAGGQGVTTVVTIYAKGGGVEGAFTAEPGKKLAARAGDARGGVGDGASGAALASVGSVIQGKSKSREEAEDKFEKEAIYVDSGVFVNQWGGVVGSWSYPRRGKFGQELVGAEFYDAVGRPDLASSYRDKSKTKKIVGVSGLLGGMALAAVGATLLGSNTSRTGGAVFLGLGGLGMLVGFAGAAVSPEPVDANEKDQLVHDYNKSLRKRLGLPSVPPRVSSAGETGLRLRVAPMVFQNGAGVALGGTF